MAKCARVSRITKRDTGSQRLLHPSQPLPATTTKDRDRGANWLCQGVINFPGIPKWRNLTTSHHVCGGGWCRVLCFTELFVRINALPSPSVATHINQMERVTKIDLWNRLPIPRCWTGLCRYKDAKDRFRKYVYHLYVTKIRRGTFTIKWRALFGKFYHPHGATTIADMVVMAIIIIPKGLPPKNTATTRSHIK